MSVIKVSNEDEFKEILKKSGSKLVVVDFFATWCGPCKMIAPKMEKLAKTYGEVVFLKVDVDECEDLAAEYEITAMPTFLFFKDNSKIDATIMGANEKMIEENVEKYRFQTTVCTNSVGELKG